MFQVTVSCATKPLCL